MNKYAQKLALFLINRRIKKIEDKAYRKIRKTSNHRRVKIADFIEDKKTYRELRALKVNIEAINGPWQGAIAGIAERKPKHEKYIKNFPKDDFFTKGQAPLPPLTHQDQRWADLSIYDFLQELEDLEDVYDNDFRIEDGNKNND